MQVGCLRISSTKGILRKNRSTMTLQDLEGLTQFFWTTCVNQVFAFKGRVACCCSRATPEASQRM